jgi:hypothetical protein
MHGTTSLSFDAGESMAPRQRAFTGLLVKPIDLEAAKPNSLVAVLAQGPNEKDIIQHVEDELAARWKALDEFFELDSNRSDIWERRGKALMCHELNISPDDPRCWEKIATRIAQRHVLGFSIKKIRRKRGAPIGWTDQRLAQLFADVEYLRREKKSIRTACGVLVTSSRFRSRWGDYGGKFRRKGVAILIKAYHKAKNKLRDWRFKVFLCGPEVLMPVKNIDPIEAAIRA